MNHRFLILPIPPSLLLPDPLSPSPPLFLPSNSLPNSERGKRGATTTKTAAGQVRALSRYAPCPALPCPTLLFLSFSLCQSVCHSVCISTGCVPPTAFLSNTARFLSSSLLSHLLQIYIPSFPRILVLCHCPVMRCAMLSCPTVHYAVRAEHSKYHYSAAQCAVQMTLYPSHLHFFLLS